MTEKINSNDKYIVSGYIFSDEESYLEASKDAERIKNILGNVDIDKDIKLLGIYNALNNDNTFKTIIGCNFLDQLRERIINRKIAKEDEIPPIRINDDGLPNSVKEFSAMQNESKKKQYKKMSENYHVKLRNSRIINIFLLVLIIIMIIISLYADRTVFQKYEEGIVDKYAAWQEELEAREKALEQKEQE
ncbi:MAG TPA: hypothetical protein GXZ90_06775 [Clostridiales bacterium]|nr:hypothetical protein [Clostridiales bacterium]